MIARTRKKNHGRLIGVPPLTFLSFSLLAKAMISRLFIFYEYSEMVIPQTENCESLNSLGYEFEAVSRMVGMKLGKRTNKNHYYLSVPFIISNFYQ